LLWEVADSPVYLSMVLIGALATALMTYINYLGIRFAAFVQTVITVLFITVGVLFFFGVSLHPSPEPAVPQWTNGIPGILSVLVMVPALMVGFDVIPQSAEEINLPPNRIGRLLVLSVGLAGAWYIAISLAVGSALTFDGLGASTMPTADAMAAVWGSSLMGQIMLLAGVGGILTSWNAFIIGGSRILYALSASGMIPRVFSRLHPKYQTPYVSILTIGALSLLSPLFGRAVLVWLVDAGSFAIVVAYLLVVVSFLKLRRAEPSMPRPFRVPLGGLVGALALILTFCLLLLYLPGSPAALLWPEEWLMLLVSAAVGAVFYWRGPARRQAAQTAK
jgi:amino acid transporter